MTYEAVHKAIKRGDIDALRTAFKSGLDPNLANKYGWTILILAAGKGNSKIGKLIIDSGADLNKRTTNGGVTALSHAVLCGSASFVELLLGEGASLDCNPYGNSLDIYLDWVASFYPEQMRRIRKAFDIARETREGNAERLKA
jgi:ankyrin repeat protein